jgi:hypothetical protein
LGGEKGRDWKSRMIPGLNSAVGWKSSFWGILLNKEGRNRRERTKKEREERRERGWNDREN